MALTPDRLRPWLLRGGLIATAVVLILFVRRYGIWTVPEGMDTMRPEFAPGAVAIIDRSVERVSPRDVVLFELTDGSVLLSRVTAATADGFRVAHDDPRSRYAALQGDALGTIPYERVRFRVLTVLQAPHAPPPELPGEPRGR